MTSFVVQGHIFDQQYLYFHSSNVIVYFVHLCSQLTRTTFSSRPSRWTLRPTEVRMWLCLPAAPWLISSRVFTSRTTSHTPWLTRPVSAPIRNTALPPLNLMRFPSLPLTREAPPPTRPSAPWRQWCWVHWWVFYCTETETAADIQQSIII